jgi:hypothetical protein
MKPLYTQEATPFSLQNLFQACSYYGFHSLIIDLLFIVVILVRLSWSDGIHSLWYSALKLRNLWHKFLANAQVQDHCKASNVSICIIS